MKNLKLFINIDVLKIFALITMSLDHVAKYLLEQGGVRECFIGLGRTSFPIFSFLLMMHLAKMNIYKKYITRLGLFGFIAFLLMFVFSFVFEDIKIFPLNIMVSFLLAVLFFKVVSIIQKEDGPKYIKIMMWLFSFFVFSFLSLVLDYGLYGFLFLVFMCLYFKEKNKLILGIILLLSCLININGYWFMSLLTTIVLFFNQYDAKYKRIINKWWIFYIYYPLHLLIIFLI